MTDPLFTTITSWAPYLALGRERMRGRPARQKLYLMKEFKTSEEYFAHRDLFTKYIDEEVNPEREENGIGTISTTAASACFRIIHSGSYIKTPPTVAPEPANIQEFWKQQAEWSQSVFGKDSERGPIGALKHLAKEAVEAQEKPSDLMEFVDCLFLTFDATRRAGFTFDQLLAGAWEKLEINKVRKWSKPTSDEPVEHDRSGEMPEPAKPEASGDESAEMNVHHMRELWRGKPWVINSMHYMGEDGKTPTASLIPYIQGSDQLDEDFAPFSELKVFKDTEPYLPDQP